MRNFILAGLCLFALSSVQAIADLPWKDFSDPNIMNSSFERNFEKLPLQVVLPDNQKLWANDYWPRRRGSINYRWNSQNPIGFDLVSPTKEEAMFMKLSDVAALAPSEKLDILNGNYNYPLKEEVNEKASPRAPIWHGICNGWSPASINHNEPTAKTLVNPDGIQVPFGSSDIKALLSYYYAYKHEVETTHQMGRRCNYNFESNCREDLNAGAFHIVLTNMLGLEGTSFVADVERKRPVWNHAINAYTTTVLDSNLAPDRDSAPGTVRRIHVKTVIIFVLEIKANSWHPVLGTTAHINDDRKYEYTLDVDASGDIIGGEWISRARPDFIWKKEKPKSFEGMFVRLSELLND